MKTKHLFWILIVVITLQACARAMTPYEAANHPKGKKVPEYQVESNLVQRDCLRRLPASGIFL